MGSNSLKDYLKKYVSNPEDDKKNKKKKKRKTQPQPTGLLVVDEDPTWQKPVDLEEENDDKLSGIIPSLVSVLFNSINDTVV
jgi:pre-mRNA-splicing factor CWC26